MGDRYRVIVTGARTWRNRALLYRELNTVLGEHPCLTVVHGAAPGGADKMADDWRQAAWDAGADVMVQRVPAQWRVSGRVDKGAGFRRNAEMVALGADLALAFVMPCDDARCHREEPHGTHGTAHCAAAAQQAGIPVKEVRGD